MVSRFTLNATSFLLTFKIDSFFSKNISDIKDIRNFFSHIGYISKIEKKQLNFSISIFKVDELQQIVNYTIRYAHHACFRSMILRVFPLIIEAANWKSHYFEITAYYRYAVMKRYSVPFTRLPFNSVIRRIK